MSRPPAGVHAAPAAPAPAPASLPHAGAGPMATARAALALLPSLLVQAARVYPRGEAAWLPRRLRFVASALRHPRAHRALVDFFSRAPFDAVLARHPRLLQKVHKPYPCRGVALPERVALVARHYVLARQRLGEPLLRAVAEGRELTVCEVRLPGGHGTLPVRLGKHARFERWAP